MEQWSLHMNRGDMSVFFFTVKFAFDSLDLLQEHRIPM